MAVLNSDGLIRRIRPVGDDDVGSVGTDSGGGGAGRNRPVGLSVESEPLPL